MTTGKITRASVTLGGMGPAPVRAREVEKALIGEAPTERLFRAACESCRKFEAIDDVHAPASYRQHLAAVLSRRALAKGARTRSREGQAAVMSETRQIARHRQRQALRGKVEVRVTLADFMRHQLGLTGTHLGCEHGVCGACTILLDGRSARSCLMLAVQADGHEILTVEGIAPNADTDASAAGGVPRQSWPAMRLLHARHADDADRVPARQSRPDRAGSAHRAFPAICAAAPAIRTSSSRRSMRRSDCRNHLFLRREERSCRAKRAVLPRGEVAIPLSPPGLIRWSMLMCGG